MFVEKGVGISNDGRMRMVGGIMVGDGVRNMKVVEEIVDLVVGKIVWGEGRVR